MSEELEYLPRDDRFADLTSADVLLDPDLVAEVIEEIRNSRVTTDHAQALVRIEEEIAKIDFFRGVMRTEPGSKDQEDLWRLRKAVLELHEYCVDKNGETWCAECGEFSGDYPCLTADIIIRGVPGGADPHP